ncbi:MAG: sigma-70 family RNA polymerase sigma factor [Ruminococcaceae bacterium]|nr:sigma-70 family RNA polymerase sigma factor [Oscillospiraceae bacterium]
MDDQKIIDLYFERNEEAIVQTAGKYGAYCKSISMNLLHSEADADECVNDTWLKTWHSIPPARPSVLSAFLARIVRCLSIDRFRKMHRQKRNTELVSALDELTVCSPAEEGNPALAEDLRQFVTALPPLDRKLFVGRYWYAYSVKRLAEAYSLQPNAVSQRLFRTREHLRAYLTERGYDV